MTQEEKELLLKDLCARLPYGVMLNINGYDRMLMPCHIDLISIDKIQCKPYLRPMSSMTEKERETFNYLCESRYFYSSNINGRNYDYYDWLNSNHFDYHDLIEKGLALEAPEGMYK